ncbi:MAG: hypothetical protein ACRD2X_27000 [Vicinamibacteraceae bacterium]
MSCRLDRNVWLSSRFRDLRVIRWRGTAGGSNGVQQAHAIRGPTASGHRAAPVRAYDADRGRRVKRVPEESVRVEFQQPLALLHVAFAPGEILGVPRVHQVDLEAPALQDVDKAVAITRSLPTLTVKKITEQRHNVAACLSLPWSASPAASCAEPSRDHHRPNAATSDVLGDGAIVAAPPDVDVLGTVPSTSDVPRQPIPC